MKPIEIVKKFLHLTNDAHKIEGAVKLMSEDITFIGPAVQCNNKKEYEVLLQQFLSAHTGWKLHQVFENQNNICVIDDIIVKTPKGEKITLEMTEWFVIENEKIKKHKVFYDPTEFKKAFGMMNEK